MSPVLLLIFSLAAFGDGNVISDLVVNIKEPVEELVIAGLSSQCSLVRSLLGVSYSELDNSTAEPDVSELTLVYKNSTTEVSYKLSTAAESIVDWMDSSKNLIVYLHGFTDYPDKSSFGNISSTLLASGESNVLALDASSLLGWFYVRASTYVSFIGEKLGAVLVAMAEHGVLPSKIHLIGHSLGAHTASFTAKAFKSGYNESVGRISGLDPAGPCFTNMADDMKLSAADADYVDVVHTCAGVLGLDESVGDADYWPNGGSTQPGCVTQSCFHSRAWLVYAESVLNGSAFPALACGSWDDFKDGVCSGNSTSYMGYSSSNSSSGNYYLTTASSSPYALGEDGLTYED